MLTAVRTCCVWTVCGCWKYSTFRWWRNNLRHYPTTFLFQQGDYPTVRPNAGAANCSYSLKTDSWLEMSAAPDTPSGRQASKTNSLAAKLTADRRCQRPQIHLLVDRPPRLTVWQQNPATKWLLNHSTITSLRFVLILSCCSTHSCQTGTPPKSYVFYTCFPHRGLPELLYSIYCTNQMY
jgi:hypothetical protein